MDRPRKKYHCLGKYKSKSRVNIMKKNRIKGTREITFDKTHRLPSEKEECFAKPSQRQSDAACSLVSSSESAARGGGGGDVGACATCGVDVGKLGWPVRGCPAEQFIEADILPRELNEKTCLCFHCYERYCNKGKKKCQKDSSRSKTASRRVPLFEDSENVNVIISQQTITLPHYKIASCRSEVCLFPNCSNKHVDIIPQYAKRCLLRDYKLYIPENSRACNVHLHTNNWKPLLDATHSDFTAQQIEEVISILTTNLTAIDFDNIEDIPPNLLLYCTGINHRQLQKLLENTPSLTIKTKTPVLALTAYLTKLRTNDSSDRLSTLFQTTAYMLDNLITIAKNCILKDLVSENAVPSSSGGAKRASGVTPDGLVLSHLQEYYYEDEGTTEASAAMHSCSETLASIKQKHCGKRKINDSVGSKSTVKKRPIKEDVAVRRKGTEQHELSEVEVKFEGSVGVANESSEDDDDSGQPELKEEPEVEVGIEADVLDPGDHELVYTLRPTELQADPLVTVPTPLLEVKSEQDPIAIKQEPGEGALQIQQTADTSQPTSEGSFTIYYMKGATNFVQDHTRSKT